MYYFADHGYTHENEIDLDRLKSCFEGVCGANFDDWVYASKVQCLSLRLLCVFELRVRAFMLYCHFI